MVNVVLAILVVWAALIVLAMIACVIVVFVGWVWYRLFHKPAHSHIWPGEPLMVMRCQQCGMDTVIYRDEPSTIP